MRFLLPLALMGALACTSGSSGNASVNGTVQGVSLSAKDAVFANFAMEGTRRDAVLITSYADGCGKSKNNDVVPDSQTLLLVLVDQDVNGSLLPASPGVFPIGIPTNGQRSAAAVFQAFDGTCAPTLDATASHAVAGTVTLETVDLNNDDVDGSFDLQFTAGAHLTGRFLSGVCAIPTSLPDPICKASEIPAPVLR